MIRCVYLFVWAYQRHHRETSRRLKATLGVSSKLRTPKECLSMIDWHNFVLLRGRHNFVPSEPCLWGWRNFPHTFSNPQDTIGITICVLIHLIRHRNAVEVALSAFRYNHIKAKIKSLISLSIALYTHNTQTFYLFLIGTQVTLFSKKANWHTRRNRVVKVIYVCMCPDLPLYK